MAPGYAAETPDQSWSDQGVSGNFTSVDGSLTQSYTLTGPALDLQIAGQPNYPYQYVTVTHMRVRAPLYALLW